MTANPPAAKTMLNALTPYFTVKIDGVELGSFVSVQGLGFDVEIEKREEGGVNGYAHQLPGRITYPNVKFKRPLNSDSERLMNWFAQMKFPIRRGQAEIVALTSDGKPVARYVLREVIPVKWSGPQFAADQPGVAFEEFEIAHHGFLPA